MRDTVTQEDLNIPLPGLSIPTCFIMECRATEGKLYFLSIMFRTWQSLEGKTNTRIRMPQGNRELLEQDRAGLLQKPSHKLPPHLDAAVL